MNDSIVKIIVGIVIFLLLSVFIVIIFIAWGASDQKETVDTDFSTNTGMFLSACTTTLCTPPYICDGATFTCKLSAGSTCTSYSDCVTGLICSGICATGPTGNLNQLCPCNIGYVCTLENNKMTICKGEGGTICEKNGDCASDLCLSSNICATGAQNSHPCTLNSDCGSNNCNNGFCQPLGIVSGTLGSSCQGSCIQFPSGITGSNCNSPNLTCSCNSGENEPGVCVTATQGIVSSCSTLSSCTSDLTCFTSIGTTCGTGSTGCVCSFPYTDPNVGTICIKGMTSRIGSCFNNKALGCDSGGVCFSNICSGPSVLAIYRFGVTGNNNLGTKYVGATDTEIYSTLGPTGNILPHKMFSISNDQIDTIYLVDQKQGLFRFQYNPATSIIISNWTILIPHNANNKTLLDVCYNGSTFLVAFDEIATSGRNDTVYSGTDINNLNPFNVQTGSGITGTQYTADGTALSIEYIDISGPNDISVGDDVLISINGTIYVKRKDQLKYTVGMSLTPISTISMSGLTGPARFYFDITENAGTSGATGCPGSSSNTHPIECPSYNNISFIGPFSGIGDNAEFKQVLQFSGNIGGIVLPTDRFGDIQYRVYDYSIYSPNIGMQGAGIIMLADAYNGNTFIDNVVALSWNGTTAIIPYRVGNTSRSLVTKNAFYVISIGSCG